MLITDMSWRELYSSAGLNRKFKGVIKPGVYGGFEIVTGAGELTILKMNSAIVANVSNTTSALVDGYGEYILTVHLTEDVTITVPVGEHYLVVRAKYGINEKTDTELLFVDLPLENDVILAEVALDQVGGVVSVDTTARADISLASNEQVAEQITALAMNGALATGFPDEITTNLTFTDSLGRVKIDPMQGDVFDVFYRNKNLHCGHLSLTLEPVSGGRYINIDPETGQLYEAGEYPNMVEDLLCMYVYYNARQKRFIIKGDERHRMKANKVWHSYTHQTNGMIWRRGGGITAKMSDPSEIRFSLSTPIVVADEDLEHVIRHSIDSDGYFQQELENHARLPIIYVDQDGVYASDTATYYPMKMGTNRVAYNAISNGEGTQVDVPDGKYVNYFIVATNCTAEPIKLIQGRAIFNSIEEAQSEEIQGYGLQLAEVVPMYQLVILSSDANTNQFKGSIEDFFYPERNYKGGTPALGSDNHGSLAGRSARDQHPIDAISYLAETLDVMNGALESRLLFKTDPSKVAFYKSSDQLKFSQRVFAGGFTNDATGLYPRQRSQLVEFKKDKLISVPTLVSGGDYVVRADRTGGVEAMLYENIPANVNGYTIIGGFSTDSTGKIIDRSLWDQNWRPNCNPRAMVLSNDNQVWADIYLADVDYGIRGYSAINKTIADGVSLPKIPNLYGGDGTATYPACTWFNAVDIVSAHGKRLPAYGEFTAAAFGVVENQSVGADPVTTKHQPGHRSACGLEQVTGVMYQWGANINGTSATGTPAWQGITGGRGNVYNADIKAVLLGSVWNDGADSGSRASYWGVSPANSNDSIGLRGFCDHKIHQ